MLRLSYAAVALLLIAHANTENSTEEEGTCGIESNSCALHDEAGPWSTLLQEWAVGTTSEHHGRHGRIMALPPSSTAYYVTDRADLMPPPPPHPHGSHHGPHHGLHHGPPPPGHIHPHGPPPPGGKPYDREWQGTPPPPPGTGKIVNRPPNPYKDQFKPSEYYPGPTQQNKPIPVHGENSLDRIDENRQPPRKQVSETDLYLLGAIEKLVYRVDLMEKRLRKMEENVHYLVAGVDTKPEPCGDNFTRVGAHCYYFSADAANWKGASYACRKLKANLLEIDSDTERSKLSSAVLSDKRLKGGDFWTGGLNPGLLWIWSHSARPVLNNSTAAGSDSTHMASVVGEGRCLCWAHDPATVAYVYRGQDCSLRHRYICEKEEDKTKISNEIERAARHLKEQRSPKIMKHSEESDAR